MLRASCHCGLVGIEVPAGPEWLINCNCSICRRNGALWAFYPRAQLRVVGHPEHTTGYIWGERSIETVRCAGCGSVTHWESLVAKPSGNVGVNMRNFDPTEVGDARLRRFDGADTWAYLD